MSNDQAIVVLRGNHPHAGSKGIVRLNNGKVKPLNLFGTPMVKVELDSGGDCYASAAQIRQLEES